MRLGLANVRYTFTGGSRGWKGDVPVVRFNSGKLRQKGWMNQRTTVQAMIDSIDSMILDAKKGKF
jgi:UDP-glucose 4-epimerase